MLLMKLIESAERTSAPVSVMTNEEIIAIADKTKTAESRDGDYILPISFARAILAAAAPQAHAEPGDWREEVQKVADELESACGGYSGDFPDTVDGFAQDLRNIDATPAPQTQAAQDAVDAARYRWLRDSNNQRHESDICVSDAMFETYFGEDLDKEIDAAMKPNADFSTGSVKP